MNDTNRMNRFFRDKKLPSYVPTAKDLRELLIDLEERRTINIADQQYYQLQLLHMLITSYFELLDHLGKEEEANWGN